ncbi:hypothetical protein BDZ94DRAFT_1258705, partial [Collybia nuda]
MDLQHNLFETEKEEDQGITSADWWRNPIQLVSWSYDNPVGAKVCHPKPPHYHELLYHVLLAGQLRNPRISGSSLSAEANLSLNPDLPGVLGVNDVLAPYEADVGFHYYSEILDVIGIREEAKCDLSIEVSEDELAYGKQCWHELVEKLFSGLLDLRGEPEGYPDGDGRSDGSSHSSTTSGLHRSMSTHSSLEFTDSDLSVNSSSVPSTPKVKGTEMDVEVANASPNSSVYYSAMSSPTRPLNASASSFVPSFKPPMGPIPFPSLTCSNTPPPSAAFESFTFSSLNVPPLPSVKIKKDEQGFYSEVETPPPAPPPRPSSALLPPFLQERRKAPISKTRAMVERLRSSNQSQDIFGSNINTPNCIQSASHSPTPSPPMYNLEFLKERLAASEDGRGRGSGVSSPATTDEDGEGWLNIVEEQATQGSKARRTRDLFLALTRHRSDSMPPDKPSISEEGGKKTGEILIPATCSSSPSPLSHSNDGWTEGLTSMPKPAGRARANRKRRSSNIPTPLPITPHFVLPTTTKSPGATHLTYSPASYFYAAYPSVMSPVSYASYMQMQFQMHQMQMRGREALVPSGEWFPNPSPTQPGTPFQKPIMNPNFEPLSAMGVDPQW